MNARGGMSLANSFVVKIHEHNDPTKKIPFELPDPVNNGNIFEFLCDEAQLPNVNTATGTIKGRYMGVGQENYAHTRIFTEFQLGFQCDADMTPLKFMNAWHGMIFNDGMIPAVPGSNLESMQSINLLPQNRTNSLSYPEYYCRNISVTKTEIGPPGVPLRPSITYYLERAWPFAIDAVPLQFGSTQLTKVTVQFYYSRHQIVANDITEVIPPPK